MEYWHSKVTDPRPPSVYFTSHLDPLLLFIVVHEPFYICIPSLLNLLEILNIALNDALTVTTWYNVGWDYYGGVTAYLYNSDPEGRPTSFTSK